MRYKGVPRGEAGAQRLKGIGGQNDTVDRSGETLSNQSIRIPLQPPAASASPPGDAFVARVRSDAHLTKKTKLSMVYANEKFMERQQIIVPLATHPSGDFSRNLRC